MRVLVISDTHGNYPLALKAADNAGKVDHIIHLGDGIEDVQILEQILERPVLTVSGNCDGATTIPNEMMLKLNNKTLLLTHGDRYGVKSGLAGLVNKASSEKLDIVLYGHTHLASVDMIGTTLFVNPGCLHKVCTTRSYATIHIEESAVSAEIFIIS